MKRIIIFLLVLVLSVSFVSCGVTENEETSSEIQETAPPIKQDTAASRLEEIKQTVEKGLYGDAKVLIVQLHKLFPDTAEDIEAQAMVDDINAKWEEWYAGDNKRRKEEDAKRKEEDAKRSEEWWANYRAEQEKKRLREEAEARRRIRIGMTKQEVQDSNWGYPNNVSRTTTSYGVRETWHYDKGYLYFEGDTLVSIHENY